MLFRSLLVIISLLVGAQLAGFVGVLLSVPFSVALVEFFEDSERRKRTPVEIAEVEIGSDRAM